MKSYILQLSLVFALGHYVQSQQLTQVDLCAGCTIVNGAGYNSHPTDCDKFVQCHYDASGNLVGEIMQCAFSTFWDMGNLACVPTTDVNCPMDQCLNKPSATIYPAEGNCRGYWYCLDGKSMPKCCPKGQLLDRLLGCIDDVDQTCYDSCFNDKAPEDICDRSPVAGHPELYEQEVTGWGRVQMPCPPGTHFYLPNCQCHQFVSVAPIQKQTCLAEVFMPFTNDHQDMSGNQFYVGNEDVEIKNGVAIFNGVTSRLIIPRFTNLEHSSTVVIKVKYTSDHSVPGLARALVSNSDCGNLPSIMVSEDDTNVYFGVGTSSKKFAYTYVPHIDNSVSKEFVYKFDGGMLSGSNGDAEATVDADGYLRNVQCGLQIGHAENLMKFKGTIDAITVYLCNPDN